MYRTTELEPVAEEPGEVTQQWLEAAHFFQMTWIQFQVHVRGAESPAPIAPGSPTFVASMGAHKHGAYYRDTCLFMMKNK